MKRKHIALTASSCALAFGLFACGDDVIMVNKTDSYVTVDRIEDVDCNEDSDGSMAFEKSTATMYVCSDGKWVAVSAQESIQQRCSAETLKDSTGYNFICDGKVIATVTNGAQGEKGDAGEGINADSVVKAVYDSVYKDLYKASLDTINKAVTERVDNAISSASAQITEDLTQKLACKVADQSTDEDKGIMTVTVDCGGATSEFDIPVLIPNKNLDEVYNKSVFVRFPALAGSCEEQGRFFQQMSSSAMLHIMEVDEAFNATGKGFSSELILKKDENEFQTYNTVTGSETEACAYLLRMQGNFSITNMMNSYAKLSTTIELPAGWGSVTHFNFSALVDMDASDTIVLDFLSDYKAARIQTLLKSISFEEASKQANEELAVAFGLAENAAAFDHVISSKLSQEELEIMTLLPGALMNAYIGGTFYSANLIVYNGYKKIFAENGDFKTILNEKITLSNNLESSVVKGYNNESAKFLVDFLFNTGYYDVHKKFIQTGFVDAYGLPACEDDVVKEVEGEGYFKAFKCIAKEAIWTPVDFESDWYVSDNDLNQDDLVQVLGVCGAENVGTVKTANEAELLNSSYTGNNSFKCVSKTVEKEGEKETKYLWLHAQDLDAELGEVCMEGFYGNIKVHPKTGVEYICTDRGWVVNTVEEYCAFNYKSDDFYMIDWDLTENWELVATCVYKGVNYVSPDEDLTPETDNNHWFDGPAACTEVYGECSNLTTSASSTCIYVYGTELVTSKKQNKNALYVCEDVEGETYGNWVEAESELAFCTAQVKHRKQRNPQDGDVCILKPQFKDNKVFLAGRLVGETSLDGFCTKAATTVNNVSGEQLIPNPYVCFAVDENRADPYATLSVGEVKTEWVRKTAAQACDYVNADALAGTKCEDLLGKTIKTPQVKTLARNWEDDTTVQAKCALQVTDNGTVEPKSESCTLVNDDESTTIYELGEDNIWVEAAN